jgi:hypothetical protein
MFPCFRAIGGLRLSQPEFATKLQQSKRKFISGASEAPGYDKFPNLIFYNGSLTFLILGSDEGGKRLSESVLNTLIMNKK